MENTIRKVVVAAYGRSPVGKATKGSMAHIHPVDLGSQVLNGVLERVPQLQKSEIDDILVGCARPSGKQGFNMARLIATRAGLPDSVSAATVNRFCSSGLTTIAMAANSIMARQNDVVVAGGVECLSLPNPNENAPDKQDPGLAQMRPGAYLAMGLTAENVAEKYHVSVEDMNRFAVASHAKATAARSSGAFVREIIPIRIKREDGSEFVMTQDECIRPDTSMEGLAKLKPCFKDDGLVTAGTSSQLSDGASFVVLMSEEKAAELGIKPIARFVAFAVAGVPTEIMGIGPIAAVPKVMKLAGMSVEDMDVIELNEAFAAQAIPCVRELNLPTDRLNPRGGAIALGHPNGATGAILSCKAFSYLEDVHGKYALVTMCVGGGMGAACIWEKL